MAVERLKINYKAQKKKNWTNPQIRNHTKGHELTLTRPQTQHKKLEHMYLNFSAPLIPSVEKIVNLRGFE